MDQELIQIINSSPFLNTSDKSYLVDKMSVLSPLDKLKLRSSLLSNQPPEILQNLQLIRTKFFESEKPKKEDFLTKISHVFTGNKPKPIVAKSILTQPTILGSNLPKSIKDDNINKIFNTLDEFYHPIQLSLLDQKHINFQLNENSEQIIQKFLNKLDKLFSSVDDVSLKRAYFMNFVESKLFAKYINTALTALRHPELQPAKIILNLLFQINPNYLNTKQFQIASLISNHCRNLAGI